MAVMNDSASVAFFVRRPALCFALQVLDGLEATFHGARHEVVEHVVGHDPGGSRTLQRAIVRAAHGGLVAPLEHFFLQFLLVRVPLSCVQRGL